VDRIKSPPTVRQLVGTATHDAVAKNLEQKITSETDLPLDDVLDAYSSVFDAEATLIEQPDEPIGKGKDSGVGLVKLHHREIAPTITPLAVEKQAQFTIGGHNYSTYIDLVDKQPNGKQVNELKTAKQASDGAQHVFQLIGSAIAERQDTGEVEASLGLDILVRTKMPKHVPIRWGPVTDATIALFSRQIDTANQMVKTGLFPATGIQNRACSWCGYTALCPAFKAVYGSRKA
jgi:hypothetical protein